MDSVIGRGFAPETCAMDKGYESGPIHAGLYERGCCPVVPLRRDPRFPDESAPPTCEHGVWTFAGSDYRRQAAKWRCPTGKCAPASRWIKADRRHSLIPRQTRRWRDLYRGRAAVEREFGCLKHHHALATLRVRGLARVALHVDLCIVALLARALARAQAVPLAA
jgi:Transposase DDE domain